MRSSFTSALAVAATLLGAGCGEVPGIALPLNHAATIREQAAAKNVRPELIAAVIYAETKFQPRESSAGAQGLMQLLPDTARFIARKSGGTAFVPSDLATPGVNIRYGTWYLRYLLDRYDGNELKAIAAYNGGMGNVDRWVERAQGEGREFGLADVGFPETRAYVEKVTRVEKEYRDTYGRELGVR